MKRQIWLTPEQRDLLVDITMYAHSHMKYKESGHSEIERICKIYCEKRTQEVLDILTGNPSKPKQQT